MPAGWPRRAAGQVPHTRVGVPTRRSRASMNQGPSSSHHCSRFGQDRQRSCRSSPTPMSARRHPRPTRSRARTTPFCTAPSSAIRADCRSTQRSRSSSRASTTSRASRSTATVKLHGGTKTIPRPATSRYTVPTGWTVGQRPRRPSPPRHALDTDAVRELHGHAGSRCRLEHELQDRGAATSTALRRSATRTASSAWFPASEGRFKRWGNWEEYDNWLETEAPLARRLGRAAAIDSMPAGGTKTVPVLVHNWSTTTQTRRRDPHAAGRRHRRRDDQVRTGRFRPVER